MFISLEIIIQDFNILKILLIGRYELAVPIS